MQYSGILAQGQHNGPGLKVPNRFFFPCLIRKLAYLKAGFRDFEGKRGEIRDCNCMNETGDLTF